jgi:serine/threonine protein phosphatase PrpC
MDFLHQCEWKCGVATDIGGSRENQDAYLVWERKESSVAVFAVFDGHGRDVGKVAAETGVASFKAYFDANFEDLFVSPRDCIVKAFVNCHRDIKDAYRATLCAKDWEVVDSDEGYLMKRRASSSDWLCVHGGTSCSVVALVGQSMFTANVGDSSCILSSEHPVFNERHLKFLGDAAQPHKSVSTLAGTLPSDPNLNTMMVTGDHSPESLDEYNRFKAFRADSADSMKPSLRVVYDAQSSDKNRCPPIFELDEKGTLFVTNKGKYYKNVRREWASLVSAPASAKFMDALAFTRSLGDLHLQTYGVTHLPEVHSVDLESIFNEIQNSAGSSSSDQDTTICVVLASDGVWDNWIYEDVTKFVMYSSCLDAVKSEEAGATRVAESFINRNAIYSKNNFGDSADNATAIVLYIKRHQRKEV